MSLPVPFLDNIPRIHREYSDPTTIALCDKADLSIEDWLSDLKGLQLLLNPDQCPAQFLNQLGNFINAGIVETDTDQQKRQKIYYAIVTQKKRGEWISDAKIKIDTIVMDSARLWSGVLSDDWILCGDGIVEGTTYYAALGTDGVDTGLGVSLIGDGTEMEIAGNIYIDCHQNYHTAILTAAQVAQIIYELEYDIVPAYFIIYLGYVDVSGIFQVYSGGIIS
jgi:hypothetical protein